MSVMWSYFLMNDEVKRAVKAVLEDKDNTWPKEYSMATLRQILNLQWYSMRTLKIWHVQRRLHLYKNRFLIEFIADHRQHMFIRNCMSKLTGQLILSGSIHPIDDNIELFCLHFPFPKDVKEYFETQITEMEKNIQDYKERLVNLDDVLANEEKADKDFLEELRKQYRSKKKRKKIVKN